MAGSYEVPVGGAQQTALTHHDLAEVVAATNAGNNCTYMYNVQCYND